ncbi:MAG: hypothetical protein ACRDJH_08290 [Thermomicrobiales bacterium]
MCGMMRRRSGADLAFLVLLVALALAAVTAPAGWQAVRAQDAATPIAVDPLETPVAPAEPTVPPAREPAPTVEALPTALADEDASVSAAGDNPPQPELSLRVETPEVTFGTVSADGGVDPVVPGIVSYPDEGGAYYVKTNAVRVTVTGDGPWTGVCSATENGGSASGISVAGGDLAWRLAGTEQWTSFAVGGASVCFTGDGGDAQTYLFDLRLRVEAADGAGTFGTVLTFQVVP